MKLTEEMKNTLRGWGYLDKDFSQIEEATKVTTYERRGRKLSIKNAKNLLGAEGWLSGIARSAFHWTAAKIDSYGEAIYFDSRKLFS